MLTSGANAPPWWCSLYGPWRLSLRWWAKDCDKTSFLVRSMLLSGEVMRELFVSMMKLLAWLSPFVLAICGQFIGIHSSNGPNSWMGFLGFCLGLGVGGLFWVLFTGLADLADTGWGFQRSAALDAELKLSISAYRDQEVVRMIERLRQKPMIEFQVLNQVRAYMRRQYIENSKKEYVTEEHIRKVEVVLYSNFAERGMEDFERLYASGVLDLAGVYCLLAAYHGETTCRMAMRLGVPKETVCHLSEKAKEKVQKYLDGFSTPASVAEPPCHIHPDLLLRDIYYILNHA